MSLEGVVALAALGIALIAVWLTIPRPLERQWQRLFKVGLSVLIAGEVEAERGSTDDAARAEWERRVLGVVHWHPLARMLDDKLLDPRVGALPSPMLEGERALVEALARLPGPVERFAWMMTEDQRAVAELLGDPQELGPAHDPALVLGPAAGWSELSSWSPGLQGLLARRLGDVVLALDGADDALAIALTEAVAGLRILRLSAASAQPRSEASLNELFSSLEAALVKPSDRVVLLAVRGGAERSLAALVEGAGLRDRCLGVMLIAPPLAEPGLAALVAERFDNEHLDTEMKRAIPYFCLADVDPAHPLNPSPSSQILRQPAPLSSGRSAVEVVDLGSVDLRALPPRVLARGLLFLLAFRLAA